MFPESKNIHSEMSYIVKHGKNNGTKVISESIGVGFLTEDFFL